MPESGPKYRATRVSVRSFARTAHSLRSSWEIDESMNWMRRFGTISTHCVRWQRCAAFIVQCTSCASNSHSFFPSCASLARGRESEQSPDPWSWIFPFCLISLPLKSPVSPLVCLCSRAQLSLRFGFDFSVYSSNETSDRVTDGHSKKSTTSRGIWFLKDSVYGICNGSPWSKWQITLVYHPQIRRINVIFQNRSFRMKINKILSKAKK